VAADARLPMDIIVTVTGGSRSARTWEERRQTGRERPHWTSRGHQRVQEAGSLTSCLLSHCRNRGRQRAPPDCAPGRSRWMS